MFSFGSIIRSLTDFRRQRQPGDAATRLPYDANAAAPNGMTSSANAQQVELAVRRAIHPGMRLHTPGRGYPPRNRMPFAVTAVDRIGINTDKTMGHHITWSELAGVAPYLHRLGGSALIGAHETQPEPGSLGHYLQQLGSLPSPRKATYLASILETAGVLEYDHNNGGAKRVRLLPPFAPDRR